EFGFIVQRSANVETGVQTPRGDTPGGWDRPAAGERERSVNTCWQVRCSCSRIRPEVYRIVGKEWYDRLRLCWYYYHSTGGPEIERKTAECTQPIDERADAQFTARLVPGLYMSRPPPRHVGLLR